MLGTEKKTRTKKRAEPVPARDAWQVAIDDIIGCTMAKLLRLEMAHAPIPPYDRATLEKVLADNRGEAELTVDIDASTPSAKGDRRYHYAVLLVGARREAPVHKMPVLAVFQGAVKDLDAYLDARS